MSCILKYLWYIAKHKWYVMLECFKHGLIVQGILHDLSKLSSKEFIKNDKSDKSKEDFNIAWNHHIHCNPHHWEYWIIPGNENKVLEMPEKYINEMICDWIGAGIAITGKREFKEWYQKNKERIVLHTLTRQKVETYLEYYYYL